MAFKNPNTVVSVTREEFDELKETVEKMSSEFEEFKSGKTVNNKEEQAYTLLDKEINAATLAGAPRIDYFEIEKINNSNKVEEQPLEENVEQQETQAEENQTEVQQVEVQEETNDILDQINDLTNVNEEQTQEPEMPQIIDIAQMVAESKKEEPVVNDAPVVSEETSTPEIPEVPEIPNVEIPEVPTLENQEQKVEVQSEDIKEESAYTLKNDMPITNAKTNSGHRTYLINEEQMKNMMQKNTLVLAQ